MSNLRSNLVVGAAATFAAMAYLSLRQRVGRRAATRHAELTWEGEGGNVPEVALENGNQGRSSRVEPPAHASDIDTRQNFPFPHS